MAKTEEQNGFEIPSISIITSAILQLADSIPGYSQNKLIEELIPLYKDKIYLTQRDIAARLQVTVQTVKNYSADGRLHTTLHMPGGISRYALKDVLEFEQKYYSPHKYRGKIHAEVETQEEEESE